VKKVNKYSPELCKKSPAPQCIFPGQTAHSPRHYAHNAQIIRIGKAISELMHREDATRDLVSRSPGRHNLLLQCVRSPKPAAIPAGTKAAHALKTAATTGAPYNELHPVKCNKLAECPLEFVTSSQDLVQCSL
jgi:hypothetical protein